MQGREVVLHACCHCGFQTQLFPTMDLTTTSPEALRGRVCQGRKGWPQPGMEPGLQRAWQTKPCKSDSTLQRWWKRGCEASAPQGWSSPGEGLGARLPHPSTPFGIGQGEHAYRNKTRGWCRHPWSVCTSRECILGNEGITQWNSICPIYLRHRVQFQLCRK